MKENLQVPEKIHVGFQERKDTYSKKLGYVIYTDSKGIKRKEYSWKSWSSDTIPTEDYNNEPTSGFVVNKNVGGVHSSYGWNDRLEKVRVFDPRGFEIEITIPNLLFILEHVDCFKGKGLDGQFVYSWHKTELVLLPICTNEYKESVKYTKLLQKNFTNKDMVVGHIYKFTNKNPMLYLGKYKLVNQTAKKYIFIEPSNIGSVNVHSYNNYYFITSSLNTVIDKDEEEHEKCNEALNEFLISRHMNEFEKYGLEDVTEEAYKKYRHRLFKPYPDIPDKFKTVSTIYNTGTNYYNVTIDDNFELEYERETRSYYGNSDKFYSLKSFTSIKDFIDDGWKFMYLENKFGVRMYL